MSGSDDLRPAEQVNHIYEYYLPILKMQYDDYPKRIRDLDHLHTIAEGYPELDQLLADLALEPPDRSAIDVGAPDRDDERLVLSTISSAKGLEWQCVFVIWIVDGRFPSVYSFVTDEDFGRRAATLLCSRHAGETASPPYLSYQCLRQGQRHVALEAELDFLDHVSPAMFDTLALVEEGGRSDWYPHDDRSV